MGLLLYLPGCVAIAILGAYTRAFQKATLYWGNVLASNNAYLPRGMQDAITPSTQTLRNVASLLLHLAIPVVGFVYFRWYITLGALLLTFIIGSLFGAFMPQPQSMFFFGHIQRSLADRRAQYVTSNDELRVEAVDELLGRLKRHLADTVAETQNRDRS